MEPRTPDSLSPGECAEALSQIQRILYLSPYTEEWDMGKEWSADTLEYIGQVMAANGLIPGQDTTP